MKRTVNEVAKLTGVSVRTLHYYDEIGLLAPVETTEAGYRLYGDAELERLQQILFFRELDFQLKEIKAILQRSDFDKEDALQKHKELLIIKRNRLNGLIGLVDDTLRGDKKMSFKEFDMSEIEAAQQKYQKEAQERWGDTDAYKESAQKTSHYTKADWARLTEEAGTIYSALAARLNLAPEDDEVQQLIADWQAHITKYYYNCTNEILAGLGQMYVKDERFLNSIDKYGAGLAEFMSKAIAYYCSK